MQFRKSLWCVVTFGNHYQAMILKIGCQISIPHKPRNLLEMKIHWLHLRPTESEILGVKFNNLQFDKSSDVSDAGWRFRTPALRQTD